MIIKKILEEKASKHRHILEEKLEAIFGPALAKFQRVNFQVLLKKYFPGTLFWMFIDIDLNRIN